MHLLILEDEIEIQEKYAKYALELALFKKVSGAATIKEAMTVIESEEVACLLCDHRLPDGLGLDFLKSSEVTATALITAHSEKDLVIDSLNTGVDIYLEKPASKQQLIEALKKLYKIANEAELIHNVMERFSLTKNTEQTLVNRFEISKRELEVIYAVLEIGDQSGIAKKLFISEATVKNHLANIYSKTQTGSKKQLKELIRELNAQS